ncbi:hypothetical protein NQ318_016031 [Aromia moschata]|uniref:Mos1 transposase HTH domain-containing protein n=1 Tax=Aromia moschata TaxID=1265417 RepID=A0AAV8X093_9CUCU|nr:hypothetical protein NQ318_016031 [Aromia moschata]
MEQRVNLKFLVKLEKTFTEAYAMLKEVYGMGMNVFSTQVFEWFKRFKEGSETTEDDPRPDGSQPVKAKATEVLNQLTEADFQHCSQQWKSRMERCRDRQGSFAIEGEKVATKFSFIYCENDPVQEKCNVRLSNGWQSSFVKLEKSAAETIPMLKKAFSLSDRQIFRWHKAFAEGREDVNLQF